MTESNILNLTNPKMYQFVLSELERNINERNTGDIMEMNDLIADFFTAHPEFRTTNPTEAAELDQRIVDGQWVALILLNQEQFLDLIQHHLLSLFSLQKKYDLPDMYGQSFASYILSEQVRMFILDIFGFDDRDAFKKKVIEALLANDEVLTTAQFFKEIRQTSPTVHAWVEDYSLFMGPKYSTVRQQIYFKRNENFLRLSTDEQSLLKLIIAFYERMKLSSWTPEGMEERMDYKDDKGVGVIKYNRIEYYDQKEMNDFKQFLVDNKTELLANGMMHPLDYVEMAARPPVNQLSPKPINLADAKLASGPDIDATKGPDHFTAQDSAEVAQHQELVSQLNGTTTNYAAQAEALKQKLVLHFDTPELEKKFTDILVSVLRGLRDVMEFSSYLQDLHYSAEDISRITVAVSSVLPAKKRAATTINSAVTQTIADRANAAVGTQPVVESTPVATTSPTQTTTPATWQKTFLPKLRRSRSPKKPIIDDVKIQQSMVMGPIDELRAMDIIEFRRLAADAVTAAMKLRDKIELLGEESLLIQAEGIKAFRQSPLEQVYLEIGKQSIITGKPIAEIIANFTSQGTPTLTMVEFTAIADLNKQLRF